MVGKKKNVEEEIGFWQRDINRQVRLMFTLNDMCVCVCVMILMMCVTLQMCFFSTQFLWTFPSISSFSHVQSSEFCLFCVIDRSLLERMEGESKSFIESKFILCFECNKHFSSPSSSSDPRIRMTKHTQVYFIASDSDFKSTDNNIHSFIHSWEKES